MGRLFKDIFIQLLQDNGITGYKLSRDLGLSEALISQWKSGRQLPKYDSINLLCDYFNVSTDYLLGRTDEPTHYNNNSNVTQGDSSVAVTGSVFGSGSITANNESKNISKEESEILDIYRSLNICDKSTFLNFILGMKKEKSY